MGFVPSRGKSSQKRKKNHLVPAVTTLSQTLVLCTAWGVHRKSSPWNGFYPATAQHLNQLKNLGPDLLGVVNPVVNSSSPKGFFFGPRLTKFKFS